MAFPLIKEREGCQENTVQNKKIIQYFVLAHELFQFQL